MVVEEVYIPDVRVFELRPFEDRVLELVRLFHDEATVRLRLIGTIAAGEPIEALEEPDNVVVLHGPEHVARRHPALPLLRAYLCPSLQSLSSDAFEIARVITPLLASLKLSGKIPIDLDPWLFAGIAILIARTGIAAFCADHADDDGADTGGAKANESTSARPCGKGHSHRSRTRHASKRPR